jgi:hypothetical protein
MSAPLEYASFLLRLWRQRGHGRADRWRVEVEHIQTGEHWSFDSLDEMLAWLPREAELLARPDRQESP